MNTEAVSAEQAIGVATKRGLLAAKPSKVGRRTKAFSELTHQEALGLLAEAEKTIEKQKRKILELTNVVLRRPESTVIRKA